MTTTFFNEIYVWEEHEGASKTHNVHKGRVLRMRCILCSDWLRRSMTSQKWEAPEK